MDIYGELIMKIRTLQQGGHNDSAIAFMNEELAATQIESGEGEMKAAILYDELATSYRFKGDNETAILYAEKALAITNTPSDSFMLYAKIGFCLNLIDAHRADAMFSKLEGLVIRA
ncbi:MAG: hypothetical protein AAGK97_12935, partial [Bacteroidota bacterium]